MSYLHFNSSLEYLNSITDESGNLIFGKAVPDKNKSYFHIQFSCNTELARAVWKGLKQMHPDLQHCLTFHKRKDGMAVRFGGRFPVGSTIKDSMYRLIKQQGKIPA